jgi:hypothetical protein
MEETTDDESIDRWFDFVEEYNATSTVPLSYILLPDSDTPGFRTPGSPLGCIKLSKREFNKLMGGKNGKTD